MNLEKEFVPYEQALALKEIEFDEPCFAFYNGKFIQSTEFDFDSYNSIDVGHHPLAPTFSQAFRWFRKNHKLGAIISQFGYGIEDEYGQIIYNIDDAEKHLCYEEAELACLIKLIEIVKNK